MQTYRPEELLGPLTDVERKCAPTLLFLAGHREWFDGGRRVSVVGTREPSAAGMARAQAFAQALVRRGMVVVSGLAEGIDTVAHTTAIDHGGRTIAVLGTSLEDSYPPTNRALQQRLSREHLVISQFAPGAPSQRTNFPRRSLTMALLSDAAVIVEAGESSGTRHLGWETLRLGRPLFLMESLAKDARMSWPAEMVRYGAQVLKRESLDAVLDAIPERVRDELAF